LPPIRAERCGRAIAGLCLGLVNPKSGLLWIGSQILRGLLHGMAGSITFRLCAGKYCIESCRIDLLPSVALERLGIHNELCSLKWADASGWMRDGFMVSQRIDSMKRHYESIHKRDESEDHLAHLIWVLRDKHTRRQTSAQPPRVVTRTQGASDLFALCEMC
jgi:hypothetical protein